MAPSRLVAINERMHCLSSWFISNCSIKTEIQELWNIFKDECHKCLQLIPFKKCIPSFRHPWINNHIKRLSNRKRNLYNKACSSQLESDWKAFKDLKRQVQRECCNAHDS